MVVEKISMAAGRGDLSRLKDVAGNTVFGALQLQDRRYTKWGKNTRIAWAGAVRYLRCYSAGSTRLRALERDSYVQRGEKRRGRHGHGHRSPEDAPTYL